MMVLTNEQGFPPRESGGSELLLGMHGFVGGQSQSSGRAPGLQLGPASCSMAWHAESDQGGGGTWWMVVHPAVGYVSRGEPRRRTTDEAPLGCATIKRVMSVIGRRV
jgi:hypothetical protein